MIKFIFTTKYFIDKKVDKQREVKQQQKLSKSLTLKISLVFVVVMFNLFTTLHRMIIDVIVCMAYAGVGTISLQDSLLDEELEKLIRAVIDLFTALTLLFIYHQLGQRKLRAFRRDKKLTMAKLIQHDSQLVHTEDSVFNRVQSLNSQEHLIEYQSSSLASDKPLNNQVKISPSNDQLFGSYNMRVVASESES